MTTNGSTEVAVDLNGLTKQFGRQVAVRDLSLQIRKGTTFGFLGPNGAGKTTTIRMLMGPAAQGHRDGERVGNRPGRR
jgi:ABC-2 type transport system ATP-binding protein